MSQNKFIEAPRHALDIRFHKKVRRRLNGLLNAQIQDEQGNIIGTVEYADGNTVFKFKSQSAGASPVRGEWDPAPADGPYKAGQIVFFTPAGESAATFYALLDVPNGISPDTGAPYWAGFPNAPAGLWA